MKLVSFSVTKYRSITKAYRLPTDHSTILIGPNNEGKSNILRALVTALEVLSSFRQIRIMRGRLRHYRVAQEEYYWGNDYPVSLQNKDPNGESEFNLEFELTESEIKEFWTEVKSRLSGTLTIKLSLGQDEPGFKVLKKGPGGKSLSKKAQAIAGFIAKRIEIKYIPAVRTADSAYAIVNDIVARELSAVEREEPYKQALAQVARIQKPVLDRISKNIQATLKEFLPNVKNVQVSIPSRERHLAMRRSCKIVVDDGTPTLLGRKGDGMQSLAALSLMRRPSEVSGHRRNLILAIEEPESHLHPQAIQQLKMVLSDISSRHQIIMTTHCPLLVDRASVASNILVNKNRAAPARDVKQIRKILGVRASDNLQHAELILLVEGEEDRRALFALLRHYSPDLEQALHQGTLGIDSLLGSSNLSYKLSQVREALCISHSFLDNDQSGKSAAEKAELENLLIPADVNFTICKGMRESEIEDLYDQSLYAATLKGKYGVLISSPKFSGTSKWSNRLKEAFRCHGKQWDGKIEGRVKAEISELVEAKPGYALNNHKRTSFDALVTALEQKIDSIKKGKL